MASWGIKRIGLTSSVLLGASAAALLLWQNVSKRLGIEDNAAALVQSHPNYAPALLRLNDTVLNQYASTENRQKIAEGSLEFSDSEAEVIKSRAKRAFANAPLNVKAITQIAMVDFLRTLTWTDRSMLLLAKSRNARDRQTLIGLSFIDVRNGNFDALFDTFDLRHRLGNLEDGDLQVIRGLSTLEEQRPLIEAKLADNPSWGEDYFRAAIPTWGVQDIKDNRQSLFVFLKAQDDDFVRQTLLRFYFLQLRRMQLYDMAYQDWSALAEVEASGAKDSFIYNREFKELAAPQPFNWRTYEPDLARAEIETGGSLYASASAATRSLIAQQLITAPIGTPLRFSADARWQYREGQGHFFWRLSCMPQRQPFYDIKMGDADRNSGGVSFDVPPLPEGCDYQDLQLYSEPGAFNQRISLRVTKVEIAPRALNVQERAAAQEGVSEEGAKE